MLTSEEIEEFKNGNIMIVKTFKDMFGKNYYERYKVISGWVFIKYIGSTGFWSSGRNINDVINGIVEGKYYTIPIDQRSVRYVD